MTQTQMQALRRKIFALDTAARAELAVDLLDSLGEPPNVRSAAEWDAEIAARIQRLREGNATLVDSAVVLAEAAALVAQ